MSRGETGINLGARPTHGVTSQDTESAEVYPRMGYSSVVWSNGCFHLHCLEL